jgi:hypothetical protein
MSAQELEDEQPAVAAAVVARFISDLMENPGAQLESYLESPGIEDSYRVEFFKALLRAERRHRKAWNPMHPHDRPLPVSYDSYWRREWFRNKRYSLATIVVLIEDAGYTFQKEIGTGGMGRVLLVRRHDRDEALKVINTETPRMESRRARAEDVPGPVRPGKQGPQPDQPSFSRSFANSLSRRLHRWP